jgi:L-malate glycosyltransferase
MKAYVVGHAYVAEDNRAKWKLLASSGAAEVVLHLPHRWPSWEEEYRPKPEKSRNYEVRVLPAIRTGREDQYLFASMPHFASDGGAPPGVLHVEQGAGAFVYAQCLTRARFHRHRPKTCFFTWINWEVPLRWPWTFIEPYNLRQSDGAICGNQEAVRLLKKHGFKGKTMVLPQLGVDPSFYKPGSLQDSQALRLRLGLRKMVVGFVGRLVEEKGVRLLIEAAAGLSKDLSLLFVGAGPLERDLKAQAEKEGVHLVHIPAVPHDEVRDFIQAMDVLVLPSFAIPQWKEQFGHVLIEAMACEVPVLGSTSAAIPEVIGDAGCLFQEKDGRALRKELAGLLANQQERIRLGKMGRERVLFNYTHEKIAARTLQFWQEL